MHMYRRYIHQELKVTVNIDFTFYESILLDFIKQNERKINRKV